MLREIIEIDEEKCDGCGLCIPNCHEGALAIVDGKAKLVKESYCDGLGNCLGYCPQDAIKIVKKEVNEFDYNATNQHLKDIGREELKENPLEKDAPPKQDLPCGCPGTMSREIKRENKESNVKLESELRHWPVQLHLLPPNAPYFQDADLLISADCVPFAHPNFHNELLKGKVVAIGCPKLDDVSAYVTKLTQIFQYNNIKSVTVARMEVPCCYGIQTAVEEAIEKSGKNIPLIEKVISVSGEVI